MHAQDRFWEMDFRRHITSGRLSELFGKSQVETDTYLRTLGWRRVAERELDLLSPETRRNLESYSAGVNAWLADHSGATASLEYAVLGLQNSGYVIEPWSPVDSIAWLKAMAWDLRGNMQEEISRSIISATVGEQRTAQLFPPYPYLQHRPIVTQGAVVDGVWDQSATRSTATAAGLAPAVPSDAVEVLRATGAASEALTDMLGPDGPGIGSNSWVISGDKTETGKPLLANDPHLGPMMPSIWYQIGLHCTTVSAECPYDMAGYSFSGLPGIVIGHNQTVGWGFTNLGPDVTDLYLEKVEGDTYLVGTERKQMTTREEIIKVAGGDDVVVTVRETEHGPLLSDASEELRTVGADAPAGIVAPPKGDGYAVALRWTALEPGRTADAIDRLNRAQTWEDFRSAASIFEVPAQNLIFASVDGTIGYQTPGRIPIRSGLRRQVPRARLGPEADLDGLHPVRGAAERQEPGRRLGRHRQPGVRVRGVPLLPHRRLVVRRAQPAHRRPREARDVRRPEDDRRPHARDPVRRVERERCVPGAEDQGAERRRSASAWRCSTTGTSRQPADSAPAAYFNVFWKNLLTDVFMDELPADEVIGGGDRWFTAVRDLWDSPDDAWWDDTRTPDVQETRDDAVRTRCRRRRLSSPGCRAATRATGAGARCTRCSWRTRRSARAASRPSRCCSTAGRWRPRAASRS